jgi:hypothetical protein
MAGGLSVHNELERLRRAWVGMECRDFFPYFRCVICGTLNVSEYPDSQDVNSLYSSMPANMEGCVGERYQRLNQRRYAQTIARFHRKSEKEGLRVIELGADRGFLLHYLNQFLPGRLAAVDAVEPNADVGMQLSCELARIGSHCRIASSLEEATQAMSNPIDLLIGIHVFDHLFALADLFALLIPHLSEQAAIFFVVHNPDSLLARVMGCSWPAYSAQHPQLLTPSGVRHLAHRFGMKIVQTGRTWNYFPMSMVTGYLGLPIPFVQRTPFLAPLGNRYYLLKRWSS